MRKHWFPGFVAGLFGLLAVCSAVRAAPTPSPITAEQPSNLPRERFHLLWHIGPQIEELADPVLHQQDIEAVQRMVDGYYFLWVSGGFLRYWPDRPKECSLNLGRIASKRLEIILNGKIVGHERAADLANKCTSLYRAELGDEQNAKQSNDRAVDRVLKTLSLTDANTRQRKMVVTEVVLENRSFERHEGDTALTMRNLPLPLAHMARSGVRSDYVMVYQEPTIQGQQGTLLYECKPRDCNATLGNDILKALEAAFRNYGGHWDGNNPGIDPPKFLVDIRRWQPAYRTAYQQTPDNPLPLAGIVFEGGVPEMQAKKVGAASNVDTFAEGAAWLLQNTNLKILFLIPAHSAPDELDDALAPEVVNYVVELNTKMRAIMSMRKGEYANPVCNGRIYFIPAGYGNVTHLRQFPIMRKKRARPPER